MASATLVGGDLVRPGRSVVDGLLRDGVGLTQAFWTFNPQHDQPRLHLAVPDSARTGFRPVLAAIDRQLKELRASLEAAEDEEAQLRAEAESRTADDADERRELIAQRSVAG